MSAVAIRPAAGDRAARACMSVQDSLVVARRNLMQIVRIPAVLVFELVQPVMFVLLFVYVFAGNIRTCRPGFSAYVDVPDAGDHHPERDLRRDDDGDRDRRGPQGRASWIGSDRSRWRARRCSPGGRPPT